MSEHPAITNLREHQTQLDVSGAMVGVSRQAVDETLSLFSDLLKALRELLEASELDERDLEYGEYEAITSDAKTRARAAIKAAEEGQGQ